MRYILRLVFFWIVFSSLVACSKQSSLFQFGQNEELIEITNLSTCDDANETIKIDPHQPLTVLVHGCNFPGAIEFRALAQVFEFHGQQTICFNYNDRKSMEDSSAELITALNKITEQMTSKEVTILGHSQGGLVSRRAFIKNRKDGLKVNPSINLQLLTISSPFAGIQQSSDCGKNYLHFATLGITVGVCWAITGEKWTEVHPGSDFIEHPGTLNKNVRHYLKIVTDERNTCYRRNDNGECIEDDFVFSLEEQYYPKIDNDRRIENIEVKAGHVEIVGDKDVAPRKLIAVLQANRILKQTLPKQQAAFEILLSRLY